MTRIVDRFNPFSARPENRNNASSPYPLEEFDPERHSDQVTQIIEEVEEETEGIREDRAIANNEIHPEGDGVTRIIDDYREEKRVQEELEDFETPAYEEFIQENAVTSTKFRSDVHPDNLLQLAGELTGHVEAAGDVLDFDIDGIQSIYREKLGELESYEEATTVPEYVDEFSGGARTLAEAEVGLGLGMAIAEAEEQNSISVSVDYQQLENEITGGHYMGRNIRMGQETQSEAYERTGQKLHGEEEMIEGVPELLSEYAKD